MAEAVDSLTSEISALQLVRQHYRMQQGRMISRCDDLGDGFAVYSEVSQVPMWNHSAWLGSDESAFLHFAAKGEAQCLQQGRRPVFYLVSPDTRPKPPADFLKDAGYELFDHETWMTCQITTAPAPDLSPRLEIVQASNEPEIDRFIAVFSSAFQIRDRAFIDLLRRQALDPTHAASVQHYVGYAGDLAACVGTLITSERYACIYNVGTLPGARNRGYASCLIHHLLRRAADEAHPLVFLQTAHGSAAERLYLRHGFQPAFVRLGFRLINWPAPGRTETKLGNVVSAPTRSNPGGPDAGSTHASKTEPFVLSHDLLARLRNLAHQSAVSLETLMIAGWIALLARRTRDDSLRFGFCSGEPDSNHQPGTPIAFVVSPPDTEPVHAWLQTLEQQRRVALQSAQTDLRFDSVLDFKKSSRTTRSSYQAPLTLLFTESDPARFRIAHDPSVVPRDHVRQIGRHLTSLLEQIVAQPHASTAALDMLSAREREQILGHSTARKAARKRASPNRASADPRQRGRSIAEAFELQAAQAPESIALSRTNTSDPSPGALWTYAHLNRSANQLAHCLQSLGIEPETYVGICLEDPIERIVALLAVLKAGGAAVPLDPDQPPERLTFVVRDTQMPVLITATCIADRLPAANTRILALDSASEALESQSDQNPVRPDGPHHAAYIIYTSGSTGAPKGVIVSHDAIARHCLDVRHHYELSPRDRVLQFAAFHFDAALEQILPPLISGATVVLRDNEIWRPDEFGRRIADLQLSVIDLPTAYWHQLVKYWAEHPESIQAHALRLIVVGGEVLLPQTVQLWRQTPLRHIRFLNAYGPTEATITASTFELNDWQPAPEALYSPVPIGCPRGGRSLYVLDRYGHLVPPLVPGELCIGGDLLARGYLNRPELTKQKFVPDPFRPTPEARLYRTGDLARYLPDGNLEFLGRLDDQVKIRGFRVELGEIETVLTQHPGVESAVVVAHELNAGDKSLAAYVVLNGSQAPTETDLRFYLKQKLPDYMIPACIIVLDRLPLTSTGKVDRRALPKPETHKPATSTLLKGPSEPLELRIQLLFEKILRRRPIAVDASFFELGGDSLQALELIVAIERATGRTLPQETLYQSSTVEGLARILHDPAAQSNPSALVPLQPHGARPPFFLIHTTPGDVLGYGNLIYHLNPDQPCFGLQSRGLIQSELAHDRIEPMAEFYIEQIRTIQPHGPYYLGGWCYGGIVAFEMAHQLLARDESVGLLALFETLAPPPSWEVTEYYAHRFRCLFKMNPGAWLLYLKQKWKYILDLRTGNATRFQRLGWAGDNPVEGDKLAQLQLVYEQNLKALKRYRSTPHPGRVTLFNAEQIDCANIPDPFYGWVGLASQIEIHTVPGTHDTMLAEPHVCSLAEKLESCLRRSQNRSKGKQRLLLLPPAPTAERHASLRANAEFSKPSPSGPIPANVEIRS